MRARRIAAVASATVLAVVALGACGGDDGGADNTKTDAKVLADKAVEYAKKQTSMAASLKGTKDGKPVEGTSCVNVEGGKTKSVKGSMTTENGTAEVVTIDGKDYFKASVDTYLKQAEEDPADYDVKAAEAALGGKWMVSDSEDPDDTADFFDGKTDGVTKGEVTEFNGKKVVPLSKKDEDGVEKTVYIAAKGDPVVVGMLEVDGESRTETIVTSMGKACDAKAPAQDQTLTKEQVNKLFRDAKIS